MEREQLYKIGHPIRVIRYRHNCPVVSYYFVGLTESPSGIGLHQYDNNHCTAVFLKDPSGEESLIEHYDDYNLIDIVELRELYRIYSWVFG